MKRLTVAQQVQVIRGLNRLGENPLGDEVAGGYLFLAESEHDALELEKCMHVEPLQIGREQFAFSLTPKGRDAINPHENNGGA